MPCDTTQTLFHAEVRLTWRITHWFNVSSRWVLTQAGNSVCRNVPVLAAGELGICCFFCIRLGASFVMLVPHGTVRGLQLLKVQFGK